jgi:hypothetical protein
MRDPFFDKTHCDKCGKELVSRKLCWFTDDVMCGDCSIAQGQYRIEMRKAGMDDLELEACGYIPVIKKDDE